MNILILSCGTRNKVLQYFKKAVEGNGKIVATDCSFAAPALYDADKYYVVPRVSDQRYLDIILDICRKEEIAGILSLIDSELSFLAKNIQYFSEVGTTVICSNMECCERALDKWEMYQWLCLHNYPCAKSFIDKMKFFTAVELGEIGYPVIIKPIKGSASKSIVKAFDKDAVDFFFAHHDNLMIQEFLDGHEIGADCYIDMIDSKVTAIFTKKKLLMRAGETDKAVSFKDAYLFEMLQEFIKRSGFNSIIDIDLFEINGTYYISEVNPRFGGGYPHAFESGVDIPQMIVNNLNGKTNNPNIGEYDDDIYMLKYNEVKIIRGKAL